MNVEFIGVNRELGMGVCSATALEGCEARMLFRHGTRVHPTVDVAPSSTCASLEPDARRACGAPAGTLPSASALRCLAQRGVFLDSGAHHAPVDPTYHSARFVLRCDQGEVRVDMIEPW